MAILFLLLRAMGWRDVLQAFDGVNWPWLLAMYGVLLVRKWLDAFQLRFILYTAGMRVSLHRVFMANALSAFYALFLPGNIVAAGAKWMALSAVTGQKAGVLNAIIYNRLMMTLLPVTAGVTALAIGNPVPETLLNEAATVVLVTVIVVFLSLYHPNLGRVIDRRLRQVGDLLPRLVQQKVGMLLDSMQRFRGFRAQEHYRVVGISAVAMLLGVTLLGCAMQAMGIDVSPFSVVWTAAFLAIGAALPLTIGNLGIREGLLVLALSPFDVPDSVAVAMGLLLFTNHIAIALVGATYQIAILSGLTQWDLSQEKHEETHTRTRHSESLIR